MFRRLRHKFSDYKFERRMAKQRYKKGYADCDCWSMNYWLVSTFPEMILNLRNMKHGAPELPFEEFDTFPLEWKDEELQKYKLRQEKDGYEYDPNSIFTKWYIILTRIAYCLKEADEDKEVYNPFKKEYNEALLRKDINKVKSFTEFWDKHCIKVDDGYVISSYNVNDDLEKAYYREEEKILKYKESMKDEAMDLIKKYFYHLWD